jgi:hypothetical protein
LTPHDGACKLRDFDGKKVEFCEYFRDTPNEKEWSLGLLDLRLAPGWLSTDDSIEQPYFASFMKKLKSQKSPPTMNTPTVWVWITSSADRSVQALRYAQKKMPKYMCISSAYLPAANERLNLGTSRAKSTDVLLLFLIKKDHPKVNDLVAKVQPEYSAVKTSYYTERNKYLEACFAVHPSELRMEFYFGLLKDFCKPKERVFGVFPGSKFLLANRVRLLPFDYVYPRLEDKLSCRR